MGKDGHNSKNFNKSKNFTKKGKNQASENPNKSKFVKKMGNKSCKTG